MFIEMTRVDNLRTGIQYSQPSDVTSTSSSAVFIQVFEATQSNTPTQIPTLDAPRDPYDPNNPTLTLRPDISLPSQFEPTFLPSKTSYQPVPPIYHPIHLPPAYREPSEPGDGVDMDPDDAAAWSTYEYITRWFLDFLSLLKNSSSSPFNSLSKLEPTSESYLDSPSDNDEDWDIVTIEITIYDTDNDSNPDVSDIPSNVSPLRLDECQDCVWSSEDESDASDSDSSQTTPQHLPHHLLPTRPFCLRETVTETIYPPWYIRKHQCSESDNYNVEDDSDTSTSDTESDSEFDIDSALNNPTLLFWNWRVQRLHRDALHILHKLWRWWSDPPASYLSLAQWEHGGVDGSDDEWSYEDWVKDWWSRKRKGFHLGEDGYESEWSYEEWVHNWWLRDRRPKGRLRAFLRG